MFYSGIALSARDSHLCVLDDNLSIQLQQKVHNDLPRIASLLEPFIPHLKIVVESTFNWYWLVDGLYQDQLHEASSLNLLLASVVVWNTVQMQVVLRRLRATGHLVKESDLRHLSPPLRQHLGIYGQYRFDVEQYGKSVLPEFDA